MSVTQKPTMTQRVAVAIVSRLPVILVRETERIMLNVAIAAVGITSLMALREPGTIAEVLPRWLLIEWSATLIAGGGLTLLGMVRSQRLVERAGIALKGLGCLTYAGALFSIGSGRAQVIGVLFLAISAAAAIRLLSSTAANAAVTTRTGDEQ